MVSSMVIVAIVIENKGEKGDISLFRDAVSV